MKAATGKMVKVVKTIRNRSNEELCRQIISYLKSLELNNQRIPSRRQILRILKCMPASRTKELKAINSTMEDSRKAFENLQTILDFIKPICVMKGLYDIEDFDNLGLALQTSARYIKYHYVFNLQQDSTVASHCINFALSDPCEKAFQNACLQDHWETCDNCELLPNVITIMRAILEELISSNHIAERDFEEKLFEMETSHRKITEFIHHLIRNHQSNGSWQNLMDQQKEHQAFATFDFGKFLYASANE